MNMRHGGRVSGNSQQACKCREKESVRCPDRMGNAVCRLQNDCTVKPLIIIKW